jgi:hypothetical protein
VSNYRIDDVTAGRKDRIWITHFLCLVVHLLVVFFLQTCKFLARDLDFVRSKHGVLMISPFLFLLVFFLRG